MSGGSMEYFCHKLQFLIEEHEDVWSQTPLRAAFAEHLKLVVVALHDIEWVDSGDYSEGDEDEAIRAVLNATMGGVNNS